jgi:hypothetical protein
MQMNQQVTFVTDGGKDVRELPLYLNPQADHLIDWFHIAMRLTVMGQMAKGLGGGGAVVGASETSKQLERLKWFLWHGISSVPSRWSTTLRWTSAGTCRPGTRPSRTPQEHRAWSRDPPTVCPSFPPGSGGKG